MRVALVVLAASGLACLPTSMGLGGKACDLPTHGCEEGRICVANVCRTPECGDAGLECTDGKACQGGICVTQCTSGARCGDGGLCVSGQCTAYQCNAATACPGNEYCSDAGGGTCSNTRPCVRSDECHVGDTCSGARCGTCFSVGSQNEFDVLEAPLALGANNGGGIVIASEPSIAATNSTSGDIAFTDFLGVGSLYRGTIRVARYVTASDGGVASAPKPNGLDLVIEGNVDLPSPDLYSSPALVQDDVERIWVHHTFYFPFEGTTIPAFGTIEQFKPALSSWQPAGRRLSWSFEDFLSLPATYGRSDLGIDGGELRLDGFPETADCDAFWSPTVFRSDPTLFLALTCVHFVDAGAQPDRVVLFADDGSPERDAFHFVATLLDNSCAPVAGLPRIFSKGGSVYLSVSGPNTPGNADQVLGARLPGTGLDFNASQKCVLFRFAELDAGTLTRTGRAPEVVATVSSLSGMLGACTYNDMLPSLGIVAAQGRNLAPDSGTPSLQIYGTGFPPP